MKHFQEIQKALHLDRIHALPSSWRYIPKAFGYIPSKKQIEQGAQIDSLLDRSDDAITLFEIKYSSSAYRLEKPAALNLHNKIEKFKAISKTPKQIFVALITTQGVKPSLWLEDTVNNVDARGFIWLGVAC